MDGIVAGHNRQSRRATGRRTTPRQTPGLPTAGEAYSSAWYKGRCRKYTSSIRRRSDVE